MEETATLGNKNITLTLYFPKVSNVLSCDKQRQTEMEETKTDCHIDQNFFFSWPYHSVLSSKHQLTLLLLNRGHSIGGPQWATLWYAAQADRTYSGHILRWTQDLLYLTLASSYITSQRPFISVQKRNCFRLFTQLRLVQRNLWLKARSRVNVPH